MSGVIYVLTNPSFPEYVKIGYADDIERRLKEFNRSECLPFAFRVYCTYEVSERLQDKEVHRLIDKLNPDLRAVETFDGKPRVREFYNLSGEDAYELLASIAKISGTLDRLRKVEPTERQIHDEQAAENISESGDVPFTEEDHFIRSSAKVVSLYKLLKERMATLGAFSIEPHKLYISFRAEKKFAEVIFQRKQLKLYLCMKKGTLHDPDELAEDVSNIGRWANGNYLVNFAHEENLEEILPLIKQSYDASQL